MGCILKGGGGLYSRLVLGAVLVATDERGRADGTSRVTLEIQGVPLVKRALFGLSGAGVDEVVVVLGPDDEVVEPLLAEFPVTLVRAPAAGDGAALRAGFAALAGRLDAVLLCRAEQPLLNAQDLADLIGAYKKRPGGHGVVPCVDGRRGNPLLVEYAACAALLKAGDDLLNDDMPAAVSGSMTRFETANDHFLVDLATTADIGALEQRLGMRLRPAAVVERV